MKIRGEYKVPIEYMPFDFDVDWVKRRVANQILQHMLSKNLIEFTEEEEKLFNKNAFCYYRRYPWWRRFAYSI